LNSSYNELVDAFPQNKLLENLIMSDDAVSRRKFIAAMGGAGAVAAISAAAMLNAAEVQADVSPTSTPLPPGIKSVQGSWFGTLTARGTTKGLATFTSNGGMMTTNQRDTLVGQPQGGGHGVWRQDGLLIETRLFKFVGDEAGVLTAIIEEVTSLQMGEDGNTLTGTGNYTLYSLDGTVLELGSGDFSAVRITITGSMEFLA
jgi:hypothetical protein